MTQEQFENDPRDYALELVDEGPVCSRDLAMMFVKYLPSSVVRDVLRYNELDPTHLENTL